jgi:lysophospholipase L1-like esterase
MLLPEATWDDVLPYKPRYEAKVRALCQETATPLVDLSHALPDEAFVDGNHLTVDGQEKFRGLIMKEISGQLEELANAYVPR